MTDDRRLIEDYLPIQAISAEASREKSVRKGHISTLHLWWARRPLVACRAAVYGSLVPADQFRPKNGPEEKRDSLGRANAAKFVSALCKYPGSPAIIKQAQEHILDAHAVRLTAELTEAQATGEWPAWLDEFKWPKDKAKVTREDIEAGRAPRPRVLDMFAGGGAIPLEALRLGCEAYALDLNPVAHIIELCTLVYPQRYGKPDPNAHGMTGPENAKGQTTWGGLAEEVRYWGNWVLEKVKAEIGDLYPPIPDPEATSMRRKLATDQLSFGGKEWDPPGQQALQTETPKGYLTPIAYLWTRTVKCKNPACGATVPLAGRTWLCKKERGKRTPGRYVALKMVAPKGAKAVRFDVVETTTEKKLGFDPAAFASGGNAACPFCGTVADSDYVKAEGCCGRMSRQMMAIVCTLQGEKGKAYLSADDCAEQLPDDDMIKRRIDSLCKETGLTVPAEPIITDAKNSNWITLYGLSDFGSLFTPRQLASMLAFVQHSRGIHQKMLAAGVSPQAATAVSTCAALVVDRLADYSSSCCIWEPGGEFIKSTFSQKGLPLMWDFVELAPLGGGSGSPEGAIKWVTSVLARESFRSDYGRAIRASATKMPVADSSLDAVLTDPPYYDNVAYADISDFFYVWLKRTLGHIHPQHFASTGTPKKSEIVADATRHGGSRGAAREAYEAMMEQALAEACRSLKPRGRMAIVYAHKTTLGWSTLVEALRRSGLMISESWPLDTERPGRVRAIDSAALASSIFLVARKRPDYSRVPQFTDEERQTLRLFCRVCKDTMSCRFVQTLPRYEHKITSTKKPDGSWEVAGPRYDDDDFRAFLTHFRKLVAPGEKTRLENVLSILGRRASEEERKIFRRIRDEMKKAAAGSGLNFSMGQSGKMESFPPAKLMDIVFNADVFHVDPDKQDVFSKLDDAEPFVRPYVLSYATFIVEQAANIARAVEFWGYTKDRPGCGSYESDVTPQLANIVRERVDTLWGQGIMGADLVIACVGAGLRAFTRFARVEYANGEEVPAGRFLAEVETVVLETILNRLSREVGGLPAEASAQAGNGGSASAKASAGKQHSLAGVDPATRFYILWRYTYRWTELDAGEAIVFANGTHVELDGAGSLSYGSRALIEKKKGKYRLLDFGDRGADEKLGLPDDGVPAPVIDVLHRTLWLMENRPRGLTEFLGKSNVNLEQLRLVAQALAGPALKGGELIDVSRGSELAALRTLTSNWRSVTEGAAPGPLF